MKNKKPLVSVIMPILNGSKYMAQAIDSILNQTMQDFELLIIDDASTDNSWRIIKSYENRFPSKVRSFRLSKNSGAYNAANFAFLHARGEYIAVMDCDDVSHPDRLSRQVDALNKFKDVILVGSQANIINDKGELVGIKKLPLTHLKIYKEFGLFHPMVHPSCMIRRSLLPDKNKLYRIKYGVNDDYYTFFSLLRKGEFMNLKECLLNYRIHFENSSLTNIKGKFINSLKIRIEAARDGYSLGIKNTILMFLQVLVVLSIPNRWILPLYFWVKGIYSPQVAILNFAYKLDLTFVKVKKFSSAVLGAA